MIEEEKTAYIYVSEKIAWVHAYVAKHVHWCALNSTLSCRLIRRGEIGFLSAVLLPAQPLIAFSVISIFVFYFWSFFCLISVIIFYWWRFFCAAVFCSANHLQISSLRKISSEPNMAILFHNLLCAVSLITQWWKFSENKLVMQWK